MKKPFQDDLPLMSLSPSQIFPGRHSLRVTEIAKVMGVHVRTVMGWIDTGDLVAVDVGNGKSREHKRVGVSDYEAFLRKRKTA